MAAWTHDNNLDAALNNIKNNCTRVTACSQQPANYTEANTTYALGNVTVASGDFTVGNGDTSGRKITMAQKTGGSGTADGTATHLAFLDVSGTTLLHVIQCTSQSISNGASLTFNAVDLWEINDPS